MLIYFFGLFKMIKAEITPGIQPQKVSMKYNYDGATTFIYYC